jgi:hypothetical protein
MSRIENLWTKKILLWFLGACCLIMWLNAFQHNYVLRTRGVQTIGTLLSVEKAGDYRRNNRLFIRDRVRLRMTHQTPQGKSEIFEGLMSAAENDVFHAAVGKEVPFIYDPKTGRYVFGTKKPTIFELVLFSLALLPAGITCLIWGFLKRR